MKAQDMVSEEVAQLWRHAKKKRYDELEAGWLVAIENEANSAEELLAVLQVLIRHKEVKQTESLLWFLLTAREERAGAESALDVLREGAGLIPDSTVLREEAASLYRKAYETFPEIELLIDMTVSRRSIPFHEAIQHMDKLLTMKPGTYVRDTSLRAPGRVIKLDTDRKAILIMVEDEERAYDSLSIGNIEKLEDDDFRARMVFDRETLAELAEDDPEALVTLLLRTFNSRLPFRDLKAHLTGILPAKSWSKWWTRAKPKIAHSPSIDMSQSTQPMFILRSSPITYEERLQNQFDHAQSAEDKLTIILDYLEETDEKQTAGEQILKHFAGALTAYLDEPGTEQPAIFLAALAMLTDINKRLPEAVPAPEHSVESVLGDEVNLPDVLGSVESDRISKYILAYIQQTLPSKWHEVYSAIMPGCSRGICELIARKLSKGGHGEAITTVAAGIVDHPGRHVRALVWLWKAACAGKFKEHLEAINRGNLTISLFSVAENLLRTAVDEKTGKRLLSEVRNAVATKNYSLLRGVLEEADSEQAKHLRNAVERGINIPEDIRTRVIETVMRTHPGILTEMLNPWEEDVIYTTKEGLERKHEERADLVNIKLVQVGKDIGNAAQLGDLSENAEYTSALEERDRITERVSTMETDIAKAKLIRQSMVDGSSVTVGSTVRARELSSESVETFAFLGPWDTDIDNGVYSYKAPLAQAFMGKSVGDIAVLHMDDEERSWEIVELLGFLERAT